MNSEIENKKEFVNWFEEYNRGWAEGLLRIIIASRKLSQENPIDDN